MIERNKDRGLFVPLPVQVTRNGGMKPMELALYVTMLTRPDGWDFHENVLAKELDLPQERIAALLRALEQKGYTRWRMGVYGPVWDLIEQPKNGRTNAAQSSDEEANREQTNGSPEPPVMTREEIAERFYQQAAFLKKIGAERRQAEEDRRRKAIWH